MRLFSESYSQARHVSETPVLRSYLPKIPFMSKKFYFLSLFETGVADGQTDRRSSM